MALRYWVGGGSSANWNATGNTNWGTASGVQDNASVPTSVDDVIFDGAGAGGNTNSTISAPITVNSFIVNSGYTATITHNAVLTLGWSNNGTAFWTMSNSHTIAGTANINPYSMKINTNGQVWPNSVLVADYYGSTLTLVSNFVCNGSTIYSNPSGQGHTINRTTNETWTTNGVSLPNTSWGGSAEVIVTGGTFGYSGASGLVGHSVTFNGNVTILGTLTLSGGTLKYLSGTVIVSGSVLNLSGGTLDTNGIIWETITINNFYNQLITLVSDLTCSGTTTVVVTNATPINGAGKKWYTNGLSIANTGIYGSVEIVLTGGTLSGTTGSIANNLTFAGNVTFSGSITYNTGTLKYTSGTVTTTGSTLNINGGCTFNANGITWDTVKFVAGATCILTSNFSVGGTTIQNAALNLTINRTSTETWSTNGLSVLSAGGNTLSGTAEIILTGGTWSAGALAYVLSALTFAGNVTVSGNVYFGTGTLKYTSGTVTTTGSTLNFSGGCTINTAGITWNNITFYTSNSQTYTLASNLIATGTTAINPALTVTLNRTSTETWSTNGLGIFSVGGNILSGTAEIILTGGTWSSGSLAYVFNDLTFAGNVTVSGIVFYGQGILKYTSGTVTTTGSTLNITNSCTLNTDGIIWNNVTLYTNARTHTLTSNFTVGGTTTQNPAVTVVINRTSTETWSTNGLSMLSTGGNTVSGTAEIILTGGTWSSSTPAYVYNNLSFAGNVTVSGNVYYGSGTLKYTSGTVATAGSTLNISGSCTLNTLGITWNNVTFYIASTCTLTSNFTVGGTTTQNPALSVTINRTSTETWSTNGLSTLSTGGNLLQGTAEIILTGGTWSSASAGYVISNLNFAGNVTISGNVYYGTGTIRYTSGTITHTGSTLNLIGSCTFDCAGANFGTISFNTSATYTINSLLSASVIQPNINGVTFAGTAGWTCSTYNHAATSAQSVTLKDGVTYTVTGALNAFQSRNASSISITSSSASLRANLVLLAGATCNCLANLTRIDASGGRPIYTFNGTVTDCVNVKAFNDLTTIASSYVNL